jgi:hypothetical protein
VIVISLTDPGYVTARWRDSAAHCFAMFLVRIRCKCGHHRDASPKALTASCKTGWSTTLADLSKRLRCSKCDERELEPGAGRFPWNVYDRAVSFSDGLLLVRKGGIRWLPHEALRGGSPAEALALVQGHLPVRVLA